jgi:NhaP-type Na+/H+ and K+/H+ antiporter
VRAAFDRFGEVVTELLKLAAILLFGAVSPGFLAEIPVSGYVFAVAMVLVPRPAALAVGLAGSGLERREWAVAAWFGPKGFASVVYGLLVLHGGFSTADEVFHLVAITVALSIVLHSSSDVPIARFFERRDEPGPGGSPSKVVPGPRCGVTAAPDGHGTATPGPPNDNAG